jgi:ribonuclease R
LLPQARRAKAVGIGDRVLGRLERRGDNSYEARVIRAIDRAPLQVIGVFYTTKAGAGQIQPTDRKSKSAYEVAKADRGGAEDGDLVVADVLAGTRFGLKKAVITERFASLDDPRSISLLCIREADIPDRFPAPAIAAAEAAKPVALGKREDLRGIPLVTIDGADARDFDDAVWAAPDPDDSNPGAGCCWLRLRMLPIMSTTTRPSTEKPRNAAIPSISLTGWCRCCQRPCQTAYALCVQMRTVPAWRWK